MTLRCFEIHVFKDGAWKMDSVFDDAEIATHEARRIDEMRRYSAIRVIEETYDEEKDHTAVRTIFRGGWTNEQVKARRKETTGSKKTAEPPVRGGTGREPVPRGRGAVQPQSSGMSMGMTMFLLALVILGGGGALVALRYLGQ